jgi:hypothetical protein
MKHKLPNEIERFLTRNPDYEPTFCADADLMQQLRGGSVHPFIIHNCPNETWAVFVETGELDAFLAKYPGAIAATFNSTGNGMILEPMREH